MNNLTKDEREFVYFQLCARKDYFKQEMLEFAKMNDVREVQRCASAIDKIDGILNKLLS